MYSLCIWPIIGFVIAASSNTFVESFRKGARISGIVSIFIMVGCGFCSSSSGVTIKTEHIENKKLIPMKIFNIDPATGLHFL